MVSGIDIRKQDLTLKLNKVNDRLMELLGEKTTLLHQFKNGAINPILAALKEQTIDFEASLLMEQVNEIQAEYSVITMVEEIGIDFQK